MPIMFNSILRDAGLVLSSVRLLRHQDQRARRGHTPYELWRDDRASFDVYQSHQGIKNRPRFGGASAWASFVGTPDGRTLFAGLYTVSYRGLLDRDTPMPHTGEVEAAGACDVYELAPHPALADLDGRLLVEWRGGSAHMDSASRPSGQSDP
jgi:hypothetical protein